MLIPATSRAATLPPLLAAAVLSGCAFARSAPPPPTSPVRIDSVAATDRSAAPVLTTPTFAFYSRFDTNLHDALINNGIARRFRRSELFAEGAEAECFAGLSPSLRSAWQQAVDFYADVISPVEFDARQQYLPRLQLAGLLPDPNPRDRAFLELLADFRSVAAPAYDACRWPAQDRENRRWIEQLHPLLRAHEPGIARRLSQLFRGEWTRVRVDVVRTVSWSGGNSITLHGGHVLISAERFRSHEALELVFHEASHILMNDSSPVRLALDQAAADAGIQLPPQLWHVVMFITTGEVVRQALATAGQSDYRPLIYEIFQRGVWDEYRDAVEREWLPYVHGVATLPESAARLVRALPPPGSRRQPRPVGSGH